ncbi:putative Heavy metal efflux system, membrane fusion protein [Nitrospira sp. KM1]|uniref:efflux RND transporter periplasmic adaptor subunit n=1 Tax=Nitrospira sp. KM1 TaxID=1936990 RepID=UPI0013A738A5|nr:efflux RND transporter periplasmic adaptor subunit [Nitrospira sp. KM1]BCA56153.1 putative Heavy metal efflux system, membrane fusion protein [Nitrospira sp. KM1]
MNRGIIGVFFLLLTAGCDAPPTGDASTKPASPESSQYIARLTPEEVASAGLEIHTVARGEFRTHRDFPGTVVPNQHALAEITTLVRGRVVDVYADLGQQVKAGDLLAMLYSGDLGIAQSAYLKANARLYVAEQSYERAKMLLAEKVIGLAEAQKRKGEMLSLRAEKREARDRLELYGMSEEQIRRLERDNTIRSYVPIMAPFDGRIILRNLTKGEVVETTEKLFTVADLSEVWVLANIPEKDIPYIHQDNSPVKQSVEVLVNAYPNRIFHGTITYVGDVLDVATRTMNLRLELANQDKKLKPEMFATIRVYSDPEPNALAVPEAAVQRDRDRRFVFVQRDAQSFEARDVSLGESNGRDVKITDGLREGEQIVVKGAFVLKSELLGEQI